jgi:hypothetical protein
MPESDDSGPFRSDLEAAHARIEALEAELAAQAAALREATGRNAELAIATAPPIPPPKPAARRRAWVEMLVVCVFVFGIVMAMGWYHSADDVAWGKSQLRSCRAERAATDCIAPLKTCKRELDVCRQAMAIYSLTPGR